MSQMAVTTRLQARREARARRCSLFRLPREIRNGIYKHVLASRPWGRSNPWNPRGNMFPGDAFPLNANDATLLMCKKPAYIGLLQSCKRAHDEVARLLYNTVEMELLANCEPEKALLKLGFRHLKYIKHMTIGFHHRVRNITRREEVIVIDTLGAWRAAVILRFLQQAGVTLYTVTLKAPWHHKSCPRGGGGTTHTDCVNLQPLLSDPSVFSNVQSIIFPDYLAICPWRNLYPYPPERNRPLTEAQKAEITSRLCFEVEGAATPTVVERSSAPLRKGFFVIERPRALTESEDNTLPPACEGEWRNMLQEHLEKLRSHGISDYWSPLAQMAR